VAAQQVVTEGGRNNYSISRAGTFRRDGLEYEELYPALQRINEEKCSPPLDDAEVATIARSACNYAVIMPFKTQLFITVLSRNSHLREFP
jgi:Primase C terminal 1 (PriCT-1)